MSRPKGHRDANYEAKRRDLLRKMTLAMLQRSGGSMSLRDLASAAEVSVPTLRHYFGLRQGIVEAVFEEALRLGRQGLDAQRASDKPFDMSIRDYASALTYALDNAREPRLGDLFAVSLAEGLMDAKIARATLRHIVDPTIEALVQRLTLHMDRGDMVRTDARAAALMLLSPILLASLHQNQLNGAQHQPMELANVASTVADAFVRAFREPCA